MSGKFKFAIDRGGTFTDVYCELPSGQPRVLKLLSVDPGMYYNMIFMIICLLMSRIH